MPCAFRNPAGGEIKSFGVFDFVAQGVQAYVVRRNRAQKKRKHLTLCRNPSGFRPHNQNIDYTKVTLNKFCFRFFGPDDFSIPAKARDKKDAESSKIVTSPYLRTAEAIFGGRKSENVKSYAGIRKDSDPLSAL